MKAHRGSAWQTAGRTPPRMVLIALLAIFGRGTVWSAINEWTSLGPEGGQIQALVIDPQYSSTAYALAGGGIFKSTDATATWHRVYPATNTDGEAALPASVLAIDPQNTNTLFAGTSGGGVFKSADGGASWSAASSGLPVLSTGAYGGVTALAVDPKTPNTIYAIARTDCCSSCCFSSFPSFTTLFKSTDGGASWNAANSGLPNYPSTTLLIDPRNPSTIYVGTAPPPFTGPQMSDNGKGIPITNDGGVFKSTDGAATWTAARTGLPRNYWYDRPTTYKNINALVINPQDSGTLYAATPGGGISKTTDGGATWTPGKNSLIVSALAIDPQDPDTIYAGTQNFGLLKSTDAGASWNNVSTGPPTIVAGPVTVSFLAADRQSNLYMGSHVNPAEGKVDLGGTFMSTDGAESWSPVNTSGMVATLVSSLAVDANSSGTLYAAAEQKVFKTADSGAHWSEIFSAPPTDDGKSIYPASVVATDPQTPGVLYVGIGDNGDGGGPVFKSTDGGASWTRFRHPGGGTHGLVVDPQNSGTIYAWGGLGWFCQPCPINSSSGSGLFKSSDGAASWTELKSLAQFGAVTNLWIDPLNSATLYAQTFRGINPGTLAKSTDGGASWSAVTPTLPSFPGNDSPAVSVTVSSLAIDPQNSNTVYAVSTQGGVFKSTDGGVSWTTVNLGLSSDSAGTISVSFLVFDPQNSSRLYARTSIGKFRSTDGGATWTAINSGLTTSFIYTLAIAPSNTNTVYAGTNSGVFAITFVP